MDTAIDALLAEAKKSSAAECGEPSRSLPTKADSFGNSAVAAGSFGEGSKAALGKRKAELEVELNALRLKATRLSTSSGKQGMRRGAEADRAANVIEPTLRGRSVEVDSSSKRKRSRSPSRVRGKLRTGQPWDWLLDKERFDLFDVGNRRRLRSQLEVTAITWFGADCKTFSRARDK